MNSMNELLAVVVITLVVLVVSELLKQGRNK
jgi:hypothetical protein